LFTFNIPNNNIVELMGNVVEKATVKVEGTKMTGNGPLLVTHWGLSGPAVILLSAWGARYFAEVNYNFAILVNWLNLMKEEALRTILEEFQQKHPLKMIGNIHPFEMTNRLWCFLLEKSNISKELRWGDLQGKAKNKFINTLLNDRYEVKGKTTFKEEFVTAGGIDLAEIDAQTMAWKKHPQLLFAGEVLDIDGVTGGFNFQAAWTTAWIAGKSCLSKI
jgi:predicted Rossmann fold flavoprotein